MSSILTSSQPMWAQKKLLQRAMRILLFIRELMVPPMQRDPMRRRILHRAHRQSRDAYVQPPRAREAAVRQ